MSWSCDVSSAKRQPRLRRSGAGLAAALGLTLWADAAPADPLARAIEQAKPCARLKASKFGVSVGLDQFKSAEVESLHVDVDRARARIDFSGSLACRTSDAALLKGDAAATFHAALDLDRTTCAFAKNDIRIVSTGGSLGFALDAAKGEIAKALEGSLDRFAQSLCK